MNQVIEIFFTKDLVFWDFDGVIKDSVEIKTKAFQQLFFPYGKKVVDLIGEHHTTHGGMSRFEKLPIYLGWAGEIVSAERVHEFCRLFSLKVKQAVIDAPWVPGVREFLSARSSRQNFVLVTATPQDEIEEIVEALDLTHCFREIHGAPKSKTEAIREVLYRWQCLPERALMVGDSVSDLNAARTNNVAFLLRRTSLNRALQEKYSGPMFNELKNG